MFYTYTIADLELMIRHWLNTVPNSYLGQDYGFQLQAILLKPLQQEDADFLLQELRKHIPPLQRLEQSKLSIQVERIGNDAKRYFILLNGTIEIDLPNQNNQGDKIHAYGQ